MLRGIFMPAGVTPDQVAFYVDLFQKVRATPDWQKYTEDAAFKNTFMTGPQYVDWVGKAESDPQGPDAGSRVHREVGMSEAPRRSRGRREARVASRLTAADALAEHYALCSKEAATAAVHRERQETA